MSNKSSFVEKDVTSDYPNPSEVKMNLLTKENENNLSQQPIKKNTNNEIFFKKSNTDKLNNDSVQVEILPLKYNPTVQVNSPSNASNMVQTNNSQGICGFFSKSGSQRNMWIALCLIMMLAFLILLFVHLSKLQKIEETELSKSKICMAPNCVITAGNILEYVNFSYDPCHNFYDYACDSWTKKHTIPDDSGAISTIDEIQEETSLKLKTLLEEGEITDHNSANNKAKLFYSTCLNTTQIELEGEILILKTIASLGGWPVLDQFWTASNQAKYWHLEKVLAKLLKEYDVLVLIHVNVDHDDKNTSAYILTIEQSDLGMPSKEYYEDKIYTDAYLNIMVNFAVTLGANKINALDKMIRVLSFEIELSKIISPNSERVDRSTRYQKLSVRSLSEKVPDFDWLMYFKDLNDSINNNTELVSYDTDYFIKMNNLLKSTSKEVLADYILWRLVFSLDLPSTFFRELIIYNRIIKGTSKLPDRWELCVRHTENFFSKALGNMFIRDNFKKNVKSKVLEMIANIKEEFIKMLHESSWMDEQTKLYAVEKARAIIDRIGYHENMLNNTYLNEYYKELIIDEDYYQNSKRMNIFNFLERMRKLGSMSDKEDWSITPTTVNAYYMPSVNEITFPAAIFQKNFYSTTFPESLNYGSIGVVIGHEITHGFDISGRQHDTSGNIRDWWTNKTIETFKKRTDCMIEQYSKYNIQGNNLQVNGKLTLGENIADNGGLKASFRAYQHWIHKNGDEAPLPGLDITHRQLFFVNYARIWCGKMNNETALKALRTSVHSPNQIRVIVPLTNSEDFSKAFNCPKGSLMNPIEKCSVW